MKRLEDAVSPEMFRWLGEIDLLGAGVHKTQVFSVKEANSKVSKIVECALKGEPQFIQKRTSEALVVMTLKKSRELFGQNVSEESKMSFFDFVHSGKEKPSDPALDIKVGEAAKTRPIEIADRSSKVNLSLG